MGELLPNPVCSLGSLWEGNTPRPLLVPFICSMGTQPAPVPAVNFAAGLGKGEDLVTFQLAQIIFANGGCIRTALNQTAEST